MRRLCRWLFNGLTVLSLLLCVATVGLWLRSYTVADEFVAQRGEADPPADCLRCQHYRVFAASYRGHFSGWFGWSDKPETHPPPPWEFELNHPTGDYADFWARTAFEFSPVREPHKGFRMRFWAVRAWCVSSLFTLLPLTAAARVLRKKCRRAAGLCRVCGYDLRATPDRCPECGTVPMKT